MDYVYPQKKSPTGLIILGVVGVIVIILIVLFAVFSDQILAAYTKRRLESVTTNYGLSILNELDMQLYRECDPPPGANVPAFWYNFRVIDWNANTKSGLMKVDYYVDLGMQEGTAVMNANFTVLDDNTIVLSNFSYSVIVGSNVGAMNTGPWTINTNGISLTLTGLRNEPVILTKKCINV